MSATARRRRRSRGVCPRYRHQRNSLQHFHIVDGLETGCIKRVEIIVLKFAQTQLAEWLDNVQCVFVGSARISVLIHRCTISCAGASDGCDGARCWCGCEDGGYGGGDEGRGELCRRGYDLCPLCYCCSLNPSPFLFLAFPLLPGLCLRR